MKILIVHNKYKIYGGEESVFRNEVDLLKKNGHEVETFLMDNDEIGSIFSKIKIGLFGFYNPVSSKMIRKKVDKFLPDIIHIHNFFPLISPSIFFEKKRKKIPVVMTLHNYRLVCQNAILFRNGRICERCIKKKIPLAGVISKCYRNSSIQTLILVLVTGFHKIIGTWKKRVDRYICLSEFQKKKILESSLNLKSDQIKVKPNFAFKKGGVFLKREDFFLYVGRINVEKGIKTVVGAFKNTDYKLKIIGEGCIQEEIKKTCDLQENMDFLGVMDHDSVMKQMKLAKGLIFPSNIYEGFPMVIVEALLSGTPVIASDIGSQSEIITDGENGYHFTADDPDDLRRKVKKLYNNNNEFMYGNAFQTYKKYYSDTENYKLLIKIYRELL